LTVFDLADAFFIAHKENEKENVEEKDEENVQRDYGYG